MPDEDRAESSVPRLLALLDTAVKQTTQSCRRGGRSSWCPPPNTSPPAVLDSSVLRIRSLRRVYNILLFGGPSHAEVVAQAAREDSRSRACGVTTYPAGRDAGNDDLDAVSASLSAVSLELRSSRRYDPANALDGLVDGLLAASRRDGRRDSAASAVRVLRLLLALRGEGGQARDADDWELVGGHGRRVLEALYSRDPGSSGEESSGPPQKQQQLWEGATCTTASLPMAMFFRQGGAGDAILRRPCQHPDPASTPPSDASQTKSLGTVSPPAARQQRQRQRQRYLLPDDCVLHGDSTAVATAPPSSSSSSSSSAAATRRGLERIPWFTDAEFTSERGLPEVSNGSSPDGCLEAISTAPLSPAAWTRLGGSDAASGGETEAPSSFATARFSGGPPVGPMAATGMTRGGPIGAGRGPPVHGGLDLCGALSQARVDARSPAVRELRLALSFPDLAEDRPTDLVEAARLHQPGRRAGGPPGGSHGKGPRGAAAGTAAGKELTPAGAAGHHVRCSPRPSNGDRAICSSSPAALAPAWGSCFTVDHVKGAACEGAPSTRESVAPGLNPVGWEQTEADWSDPSFPKWALSCAPLATAEGGASGSTDAFELCYRGHFGGVGPGGWLEDEPPPATTEAEVARRALAVLHGVPSASFWYDERRARMRVHGGGGGGGHRDRNEGEQGGTGAATLLPPRVAGLSPGALSSLLEEFARAGTWYRRVEGFASRLVDRSSAAGQVARAFGVELRRQLAAIHSAVLEVAAEESAGLVWDGADRFRSGARDHARPAQGYRSLTGLLVRTTRLRRAAGALAEVCGLFEEDLGASSAGGGGVAAVAGGFPRGASLLTYLYHLAEIRVASEPAQGKRGDGANAAAAAGRVMEEKDSTLALLSSAAAPYLAMLGRWLWSGDLRAEDDPCGEFPLHCRDRPPTRGSRVPVDGSGGGSGASPEPWVEDGGGSFMTLAFSENEAAGVPCFLEGGVLTAAAQAGKLLRMLKVGNPYVLVCLCVCVCVCVFLSLLWLCCITYCSCRHAMLAVSETPGERFFVRSEL